MKLDLNHLSSGLLFHFVQKACHNVEESERLVEKLQEDVSALKRQLREKRQNGAGLPLFLLRDQQNLI